MMENFQQLHFEIFDNSGLFEIVSPENSVISVYRLIGTNYYWDDPGWYWYSKQDDQFVGLILTEEIISNPNLPYQVFYNLDLFIEIKKLENYASKFAETIK